MSFLKKFFVEEDGQDMVEYGLIIALVVAGGVAGYKAFGGAISNGLAGVLSNVGTSL